jgi:hypothetical protein
MYVRYNSAVARSLCGTPVTIDPLTFDFTSWTSIDPPLVSRGVFLKVQCDAGYSFGRILNLSSRRMTAQATAALGWADASGNIIDSNQPPPALPVVPHLTARLIVD